MSSKFAHLAQTATVVLIDGEEMSFSKIDLEDFSALTERYPHLVRFLGGTAPDPDDLEHQEAMNAIIAFAMADDDSTEASLREDEANLKHMAPIERVFAFMEIISASIPTVKQAFRKALKEAELQGRKSPAAKKPSAKSATTTARRAPSKPATKPRTR